jgi:transducin (beta)-like 1
VYDLIKPEYLPARSSSIGIVNGTEENGTHRPNHKPSLSRRQVNGDAMDVDENGYGPSEQASDVDSPLPLGHAVQALDTLTIGSSAVVSTEKIRDLFPESQILNWREGASISHSLWSNEEPSVLFVAGSDSLTTFNIDDSLSIKHHELQTGIPTFDVQAVCLLDSQAAVVSAVEKTEEGDESRGSLVLFKDWGFDGPEIVTSVSGIIFALRYNPSTGLLLALSGDDTPLITVYRFTGDHLIPLRSQVPKENSLYDIMWMDDSRFIACGTNTLQIFSFENNQINKIQTLDMRRSWFQIKYDPVTEIAALVDEEMKVLRQFNVGTEDTKTQAFDEPLSDFEFQPLVNRDSWVPGSQRLLATSTQDGTVQLWDVMNPFTCVHKLNLPGVGVAMKISFSPDGYLLAAAGYDTVAVWKPEDGGQPRAVWRCEDESVWKSNPTEGSGEWVHCLGWDMLGMKLVFTLDDQVRIWFLQINPLTIPGRGHSP